MLYPVHVADAQRRRIRLIGHDRPGYGGSTPMRGRTVGDEAADVRAIADALGIDRFAVWGHSGGGAPALACAALLPNRVVAAASLAGVAPYPAEGLDWLAGMGELNVTEFHQMMEDPTAWEKKSIGEIALMRGATLEQLKAYLSSLLSDVDQAALTDELATFLQAQTMDGLLPDSVGMVDDNLTSTKPWGFVLSSIRPPVQLWHGSEDHFVPFSHGKWLAAHVAGVDAHLHSGEGHLTLYADRIPAVHEWLLSHF
jgi:pimeloyl-ACP methyl ester carboxylesterase